MSVLMRTRISSFLSGVAVAGAFAMYQLRHDVLESRDILVKQIGQHTEELEQRVTRLEGVVAKVALSQDAAPPGS